MRPRKRKTDMPLADDAWLKRARRSALGWSSRLAASARMAEAKWFREDLRRATVETVAMIGRFRRMHRADREEIKMLRGEKAELQAKNRRLVVELRDALGIKPAPAKAVDAPASSVGADPVPCTPSRRPRGAPKGHRGNTWPIPESWSGSRCPRRACANVRGRDMLFAAIQAAEYGRCMGIMGSPVSDEQASDPPCFPEFPELPSLPFPWPHCQKWPVSVDLLSGFAKRGALWHGRSRPCFGGCGISVHADTGGDPSSLSELRRTGCPCHGHGRGTYGLWSLGPWSSARYSEA
jgi:hypothetical protein